MPTSYTSLIGLALPVTGELSGTWGDVVNNYITNYLDSAVAGTQTISGSQTAVTLSVTNGSSLVTAGSGATGSAQFQIINCTGNPAGLLTITAPASSRQYIIINATSTSQSVKIVGTGPTTGVTLIAGEKAHVAWNGSDFVKIATTAAAGGSNTQVQYNSSGVLAGSSNMTFDGTNLTVGGTASATKLIPTGGAITGNGMYLPAANSVSITTNGANAIYIDANQNVGFGTTLAAWGSGAGMKAIQMGGTSFSFLAGSVAQYIYGNAYYDGTNNRYINNGTACSYGVNASGQFQWFQAASGTAGNTISFTQAMTLDASGNLGLGVTPSAWGANFKAMQIGRGTALWSGTATDATFLSQNAYYDGTNFRYLQSAYASYYSTQLGQHLWYNATSGTAGNIISFTQAMTLDASGNLGLGVTPSAWDSSILTALQVRSGSISSVPGGGNDTYFASNAYYNVSWKYIAAASAPATYYRQANGVHSWHSAASGTAGNTISFTQAMTLDSSGNLLVGTTSARDTAGTRSVAINGGALAAALDLTCTSGRSYAIYTSASATGLQFYDLTASAERMRLDSSGNLGLGTTSITNCRFQIKGANNTTNAYADGVKATSNNETVSIQYSWAGINASSDLIFATGGTERARITSGGDLYVGQTTGGLQAARSFSWQGAGDGSFYISHSTANASGDPYIRFGYNATQIGTITQNGTTAVAYNTSSDYRLKENIQPMTGALAKVAALKPCTYKWKADGSDGEGFIAHELAEVAPQCVTGEKDAVDAEGKPVYQGIDTSFLVATLTAAIQEQQALIQSLTARIAALESKGA